MKNPPPSCQQPAIDVISELNNIKQDVDKGTFKNQYAFEATLQKLVYAMHDSHVTLYSGILLAFSFASPYALISLSIDGIQEPNAYVAGMYAAYVTYYKSLRVPKTMSRPRTQLGKLLQ